MKPPVADANNSHIIFPSLRELSTIQVILPERYSSLAGIDVLSGSQRRGSGLDAMKGRGGDSVEGVHPSGESRAEPESLCPVQ
jgi:hypothetical protein